MTTANKAFMCPRCGHRVDKGEPIRFEPYTTRPRHRFGSGRSYGGGERKLRPIHAHDCNGMDAMQAKAQAAAEAARNT
jgi:hypothetical protein